MVTPPSPGPPRHTTLQQIKEIQTWLKQLDSYSLGSAEAFDLVLRRCPWHSNVDAVPLSECQDAVKARLDAALGTLSNSGKRSMVA